VSATVRAGATHTIDWARGLAALNPLTAPFTHVERTPRTQLTILSVEPHRSVQLRTRKTVLGVAGCHGGGARGRLLGRGTGWVGHGFAVLQAFSALLIQVVGARSKMHYRAALRRTLHSGIGWPPSKVMRLPLTGG
jgi:hypothetical protein